MAVASSRQFTVLRSVQSFTSILFNPLDPPCPRLPLPKRAIILDLPDELLWSIFSRCMDPHASPFSNENPLQPLMKVCVRWRAVILEAPQFWSHISFPGWRRHGKGITPASLKEDEERVGVQVVKSGDVPVTIRLVPVPDYDSKRVVETMLCASTRAAEAELILDEGLFKRISTHAGGFPILQRLNVRLSEALGAEYNAAAAEFFGSLTALKSLSLASDPVSGIDWLPTLVPLAQMWARLRICELTDCMVDDVLLILPHFSPGTRLSLILGKLRRVEDPKTLPIIDHTNIQSLSFNRCGDHFVETILRNITAPSLQRLAIWWYSESAHLESAIALLRRSNASLTHFATRLLCAKTVRRQGLDVETMLSLFEFLSCECVGPSLIDLDMTLVSRYTPPTLALIDALSGNQHSWVAEASPTATLPTLPSLRSLALREYDEEDGEWERRLVDIAKKRTPVLRSIWLDDPTLNPSLNHRSLKVLREKLSACEVELVCSYDGDMGSW